MLPPPVELRVPDATFLHEEHFPGAPCLPGSCLLEAVRRAAVEAFGCPVLCMAQARFRHFVPPASLCRLIWKLPPPLADHTPGMDDGPAVRPAVRSAVRRVGWQLVGPAPETAGGAPGRRLAEGEVWLASGGGETACD